MTDKADHLIERAAALLRAASIADAPDHARIAGASAASGGPGPFTVPLPGIPFRTNNLLSPAAFSAGASPPLLMPQTRSLPVQNTIGSTPVRPRTATLAGMAGALPTPGPTSVRDIPQSPLRTIITLDALERAGLVVARTKRTRISEEYRIVIGRVLRALNGNLPDEHGRASVANNVLLVTSARPGEGKSFTALNLAGSIAQNTGESVLLVDVDPKIKPISAQLGLGDCRGFLDLIADPTLAVDDLILPTALPNLFFLPVGTRLGANLGSTPTSADDSGTIRPISPVIQRLADQFPKSLIMLDSPPCLSTSDPHTLAGSVGQVVMVVEAERTQRSEVEAALDLVRVCPSITILLNKMRLTTSYTFGAYDYFGSYN